MRNMIGYVGQEPVLIIGTIEDNLRYGKQDATEAEMKEALELANAMFVYDRKENIKAYVGSATVSNLSGGQKQRIAIARALIKKPKILVLDEATSALDSKSEKEVQNAIRKIQTEKAGELTIIMIAHRLETIKSADHLLYLESPFNVIEA